MNSSFHKKISNRSVSATVNIRGIGKVLFQRSSRARHICLSIRPFKGVRVAVPHGVAYSRAQRFIRNRIDWIRKNQQKVRQVEHQAIALSKLHPINRCDAESLLTSRLAELARQHGFAYNNVYVRNQKTRWGSCSAANNISLNINLVRLPSDIMDYALLHELVHTRVKNHGPQFWEELNRLVGDARRLDRELGKHNVLLLAAHLNNDGIND